MLSDFCLIFYNTELEISVNRKFVYNFQLGTLYFFVVDPNWLNEYYFILLELQLNVLFNISYCLFLNKHLGLQTYQCFCEERSII